MSPITCTWDYVNRVLVMVILVNVTQTLESVLTVWIILKVSEHLIVYDGYFIDVISVLPHLNDILYMYHMPTLRTSCSDVEQILQGLYVNTIAIGS